MRIELEHVGLGYGDRELFHDLDVVIPHGRVTVIVGPSGSGKSSLLAAMAGYRPPSSGRIRYRSGRTSVPPDARYVTWVPQGSNALPARTALDNAMIGALSRGADLASASRRATDALAAVGLWDLAPNRARLLSGGELQRLGFARALAAATPFIFADEPTSSLDAQNVDRVADLLAQLGRRSTVVVATHDPALVRTADLVVDLRAVS